MLRAATAADLAAIDALNRRVLAENYDLVFYETLLRQGAAILVVEVDARIVAYIVARAEHDAKGQVVGHIYSLGVAPEHRRRGYARQLLLAAERQLRGRYGQQLHNMMLHVRKSNRGAQTLYLGCGYGRAKKIKDYYGDEDGWQMRKY